MKSFWIIVSLFCMLLFWSCTDDTSAYITQQKEEVELDEVVNENEGNENDNDVLPDGVLVTGIHEVDLDVTLEDGTIDKRRFKYYLPITIDESKPISLIFEFHGSWEFDPNRGEPDPIGDISSVHPLIQHAIQKNCVICFPAGSIELDGDTGYFNWQDVQRHLSFFDNMVAYFKSRTPNIDPNRIYATGQSSGAIFTFNLALYRSEILAAIVPRAGSRNISHETQLPACAVPFRVLAGMEDHKSYHEAVLKNVSEWTERIGGYFPSDMTYTENALEIDYYTPVDIRAWNNGSADMEIYSLQKIGHNISLNFCMPYIWEFMEGHVLGIQTSNLYLNCERKDISATCGSIVRFRINYTEGAEVYIEEIPRGWNVDIDGQTVVVRSPVNFYGDVSRHGKMKITASMNGFSKSYELNYSLETPKSYFEVGDIYYNDEHEAVGVVCWVNKDNIREAKIIDMTANPADDRYGMTLYCEEPGLGSDFTTPDTADGEKNTLEMVNRNSTLKVPMTSDNSAFMWAHEYSYRGIGGWYLPAIDELKDIAMNLDKVNAALESVDGVLVESPSSWFGYTVYSSTTGVSADGKYVHAYNFTKDEVSLEYSFYSDTEYYDYVFVRLLKKVKM